MWKQKLIWICAALTLQIAVAQNKAPRRYKDEVFKEVTVESNQSYKPDAGKDEQKSYLFDLYQPKADDATGRPLIIWMHGGGFKLGTKRAKAVRFLSENFAQRGYVCASINYRLSKENPLLHFDALLRASYYATQDAKRAVAYFRKNAAKYHIDPDKIILAGNSAGGFMALDAVYAKNEDFGRMASIPDAEISKNGLPNQPVFAVINYWGGIYNLEWLKNARTPIISVHGSEDGLVPITHKDAPLHGSLDIQQKADELHIPNTLKIFEGYSHELQRHFNPFYEGAAAKSRWREAARFTADYLYGLMNGRR
ncbi:alpha/beta hydrolase [Mucilaginibacter mali]|uniref:Alpha/beta hydrolase n=1 Tax=Mucilaginibacter mali TaxID=2740462 RepID=A0A7D4QB88_9SPHI|nr:alpha/beta hydrolase [Mucilaginibacter mali]QKJ32491.1 alpha/beta hydrolase [Mucilaginibacter mali]